MIYIFKKLLILVFFISVALKVYAGEILPKSFRAKYIESSQGELSKKLRTKNGIIEYKYPGNIKIFVPNEHTFVANNSKSWFYTPPLLEGEKGQVSILEGKDNFYISKFFDALRHGFKSNKIYSVKSFGLTKHLNFSENFRKQTGIKLAKLYFKTKRYGIHNLDRIELIKLNDTVVTQKFRILKSPIYFSKQHFIFKIPKNTIIQ